MEFIQKHKILLAILSFLFIWLPQYVDTIWSLVERIQQVNEIPFNIYWLYIITAPIGLIMLGIIVRQSQKAKTENYIPDLLWKMHRRLIQLAEKRAGGDIDIEKFQIANELIIDSTGIIGLEEQDKVMAEIKDRLDIDKIPKTTKGKKKLSRKLLHLTKEYQYILQDKECSLDDLIKIGEALDGQQMGIGNLRDRDSWKWKRWYKKVNSEKDKYNDDELDRLVNDNIFLSYGCCSEWLHTVYILKMSNEVTELIVSQIRGVTTNMKINIDRAMEEKTRQIINRIKELQSQGKINDR